MISFSVPCTENKVLLDIFNEITTSLVGNNIRGVSLSLDGGLLFVDSFKARVWIDILEVETTELEVNTFIDRNLKSNGTSKGVLYKYLYDISAKSRDLETLSIMLKLAYVLSSIENSFVFDDNGLLDGKEIYFPDEMKKFIQ